MNFSFHESRISTHESRIIGMFDRNRLFLFIKNIYFDIIFSRLLGEKWVLNVLIVDDDRNISFLLSIVVQECGGTPYLASNGREALAMIEDVNPQLVFLDIKMPILDGLKTLKNLRERHFKQDIIIITAFSEIDLIEQAYKYGVTTCLVKPFDVNEVISIVKGVHPRG